MGANMPEGYATDTDVIRNAAAILDGAHKFFNDRLVTVRQVGSETANTPFVGGRGKTGGFQGGLGYFDKRFREVLDEYIDDEKNFVLFIQQAHDRLTNSAALYDSEERGNTLRMTAIARQLDGEQQ